MVQEHSERRPALLAAERRDHILEALKRDGKVLASELSVALSVSEDTVRRDLKDLSDAGLIQRVHGGALPRSTVPPRFLDRQEAHVSAKSAIADAALKLIKNGQVIILDGSTTTLQLAQRLPRDLAVQVVTNSPPIAMALSEHPSVEVIMLGGRLYKPAQAVVGAATLRQLAEVRADVCFLGLHGLHPEAGLMTTDMEESFVKRQMMASSAKVAALVTAEKLGTVSSFVVGPAEDLTHLVTEGGVPRELLSPYQALGVEIVTP
jgi:DeoR/GlpR family transcriptional regulator of sugar metabolism